MQLLKCTKCDELFKNSDLLIHKKTHLRPLLLQCNACGEKPFLCNKCDERFVATKDLLKHHRYQHSNENIANIFICNHCEKSFSQSGNLFQHHRIHTGEKPFACNVCDQSFRDRGNLKKHKKNHTNDEKGPHQGKHQIKEQLKECTQCYKTFENADLASHNMTHSRLANMWKNCFA